MSNLGIVVLSRSREGLRDGILSSYFAIFFLRNYFQRVGGEGWKGREGKGEWEALGIAFWGRWGGCTGAYLFAWVVGMGAGNWVCIDEERERRRGIGKSLSDELGELSA